MSTIQQLLNDINLRYRNTFTTDQKLVWMNEEQEELFQIFEIDSPPYGFTLARDENDKPWYLYPIPEGVDIDRIKVIDVQINDVDPPQFKELEFRANDDYVSAWNFSFWYTIIENNFFIYLPGDAYYQTTRNVYIYCDTQPTEITSANLNVEPSVPVRYQEILKLGVLKRIAQARKDVTFANNFEASREDKINDFLWRMQMSEPEFHKPTDVMPRTQSGLPWPSGWPGWRVNGF